MHSTIKTAAIATIMDRQDRRNRPIKFLDDGSDCDDRDDHMETGFGVNL